MKIVAFDKCSLVDWPGRVASVLFTPTCNMDCFFCHNRRLLGRDACSVNGVKAMAKPLNRRQALQLLSQRRRLIKGVVITGGEPTLQPGLRAFIGEARKLKLPIKLDTNGSRPHILEPLVQLKLVDFVAMDIKAPAERYHEITGSNISMDKIGWSIDLIRDKALDYEFRTTCVPQLTEEDMLSIGRRLEGAKHLVLQQYRPLPLDEQWLDMRHFEQPHDPDWFARVKQQLEQYVEQVSVRGVEITERIAG